MYGLFKFVHIVGCQGLKNGKLVVFFFHGVGCQIVQNIVGQTLLNLQIRISQAVLCYGYNFFNVFNGQITCLKKQGFYLQSVNVKTADYAFTGFDIFYAGDKIFFSSSSLIKKVGVAVSNQ